MKKTARKKRDSFFEQVSKEIEEDVKGVVDEPQLSQKKSSKIFSNKPLLVGAFVVILIILVAVVVYATTKLKDAPQASNGQLNAAEITNLVKEVGDKIMIPEGETPTIATVTDVSKLANQPFFKNSENGDKVMIFGSTKEAILYRPSIHKIISVAPFNAAQNGNSTSSANQSGIPQVKASITPTPAPIKITILNGTKEVGLAKKAEALIKSATVSVISLGNTKGDYDTTIISSVAKDKQLSDDMTQKIGSSLSKVKAKVSALPSVEAVPVGADIVIILGKDFSDAY